MRMNHRPPTTTKNKIRQLDEKRQVYTNKHGRWIPLVCARIYCWHIRIVVSWLDWVGQSERRVDAAKESPVQCFSRTIVALLYGWYCASFFVASVYRTSRSHSSLIYCSPAISIVVFIRARCVCAIFSSASIGSNPLFWWDTNLCHWSPRFCVESDKQNNKNNPFSR